MREIKFRVWDLSVSKYRTFLTLSANTGAICSSNPEHYVLEQFTGLHDKNGKEIYEGDILKRESFTSWVITFNNSCFCAANITMPYRPFTLLDVDMSQREVIGNIHENPELING